MSKHDVTPLISQSVGRGAVNNPTDVITVKYLLNIITASCTFPNDDKYDDQFMLAIRDFQFRTLKFQNPDGRVDPNGRTLRGLVEHACQSLQRQPGGSGNDGSPIQVKIDAYLRTYPLIDVKRATAHRAALTPGSASKLTDADFQAAAQALAPGVQVAMIHAFAEVESGGRSGFGPAGLPVIAYEGHIFRRYTKHIYDATHPLLSYPYKQKAGPEWKENNKDQETAWKTLGAAMELDHDAALLACSWGMFQVMGFNYEECGYSNVDDFVAAMKASERGQLDAFVGYCKKTAGLRAALAAKDFVTCATLYNGSDYGDYDQRISKAFKKYGGT